MDSITHIALGACIGEAMLAKQVGKKALVTGAIAQSLPDIDVVASLWLSPADNLLFHRSITHSILFAVVAALLFSFITKNMFRQKLSFQNAFLFFCFQLLLHDVLDTCNAYGTGLFEPFSHQRFSFNLLYVADPFFTISIVIAFVALVVLKKESKWRMKWLVAGLLPASFYLIYTIANKSSLIEQVKKSLLAKHIEYKSIISTPTPFNSFLWYNIAATDSGYFIGYRSVFDKQDTLTTFTYYPKNKQLLENQDSLANVKQLVQFANDYYTVEKIGDLLVFNVLRFGQTLGWQDPKAVFTFQYYLSPSYDNRLVVQRGRFKGWNKKTFLNLYNRIKGQQESQMK